MPQSVLDEDDSSDPEWEWIGPDGLTDRQREEKMTRRVIPDKKVVHKGMTVATSGTKVEIDVPGQPHFELTHEEYHQLSDLMDDISKWHDD